MMNENPRRLIVEGYEDLYSVRGIMRAHINWPETLDESLYPVFIDRGKSAQEILRKEYLGVILKSAPIKILGIMIDADESSAQRYQSLYNLCIGSFPSMPNTLPAEGLVVSNGSDKRLGAWIMPDNQSEGDLETFLRGLVPNRPLWEHAERSTDLAKRECNAPYRDAHVNKAMLYSWLSWQDPPVQNPGKALDSKSLDATLPAAQPFVTWFRTLYGL